MWCIQLFCWIYRCRYITPVCGLPCHSLNSITLEVLNFDRVHLSVFSSVMLRKSLPTQQPWRYSPMFSSASFIVLSLTVRSRIYFELILWILGGKSSSFFCTDTVSATFIVQNFSFPHRTSVILWCFWHKSSDYVWLFTCTIPHCLEFCSSIIILNTW